MHRKNPQKAVLAIICELAQELSVETTMQMNGSPPPQYLNYFIVNFMTICWEIIKVIEKETKLIQIHNTKWSGINTQAQSELIYISEINEVSPLLDLLPFTFT